MSDFFPGGENKIISWRAEGKGMCALIQNRCIKYLNYVIVLKYDKNIYVSTSEIRFMIIKKTVSLAFRKRA